MTGITKQVKRLSRTQVGVSLIKEDLEILNAKLGSIVNIDLDDSERSGSTKEEGK